jgi:transmembrane sensor
LEHALLLLARVHGGDPAGAERARAELADWRNADPAHEAAYGDALRRWAWLDTQADTLAVLGAKAHAAPTRSSRCTVLKRGAALAVAAVTALALWRGADNAPVVCETTVGETATIELADRSTVDVAPRSRIEATLTDRERAVMLDAGAARFAVAKAPDRPFTVRTAEAEVRVTGTVFTVTARAGFTLVDVEEGSVIVTARGHRVTLSAGDHVEVRGDAPDLRLRATAPVAAARGQWISFEDAPLPVALATLNAYRDAPVVFDTAELAHLRLTGTLPTQDPAAQIALVTRALPVRVENRAAGTLALRPQRPARD